MYSRKRASRHPWDPSSITFTGDCSTVRNVPVLVIYFSVWASNVWAAPVASSMAACVLFTWRCCISLLPSCRNMTWSLVLNSVLPIDLQSGVLWWHMRLYISPRQIELGWGSPAPPAWLTGRWSPELRICLCLFGKGMGGRIFPKPPQPGGKPPQYLGWHAGQNPTNFGRTLQTSIGFMWILERQPSQHLPRFRPPCHLICYSLLIQHLDIT